MSTSVRELFRQASDLDEHDRAVLAGLLLESLEHEVYEDVETAWKEEIERRLGELDADSVELVPWEELKAKPSMLVPNARIRFHPAAAAEVEAAMQWYAERSPIAARASATEVNTCVERVGEAPNRWPPLSARDSPILLSALSFSLVYRVRNGEIEIVAVAHHRRRPGYWRRR